LKIEDRNHIADFRSPAKIFSHQFRMNMAGDETLQQLQGLQWTLPSAFDPQLSPDVTDQVVPFAEWQGLNQGDRLIEVCTTYAEIPQRWVVVESEKRREADLKALHQRQLQPNSRLPCWSEEIKFPLLEVDVRNVGYGNRVPYFDGA
jgi:hypothetical protein